MGLGAGKKKKKKNNPLHTIQSSKALPGLHTSGKEVFQQQRLSTKWQQAKGISWDSTVTGE